MIYFFNPGHEAAVLNGSRYYMPPANVSSMQRDLSFLPFWYSGRQDYILVEQLPDNEFISFIEENFHLPVKAISEENIQQHIDKLKNQEVSFWGISPQAIHRLEIPDKTYRLQLSVPSWNDIYKELCGRETARRALVYLTENSTLFSKNLIPEFYTSLEEIEKTVSQCATWHYLAKAPYSSSGRGLVWLPAGKITRTERQLLHGHLKKQGKISLEKVLDKKLDFAMEFYSSGDTVEYLGLSFFTTDNKGAYTGNYLGSQENILSYITKYIDKGLLEESKNLITAFLQDNIVPYYTGYMGIDMMVYKEEKYHLHPCLEINVRCNMGIVALYLSRHLLAKRSTGNLYIDFEKHEGESLRKHTSMCESYPLEIENNKIKSGYFCLCPVNATTKYRAYIIINNQPGDNQSLSSSSLPELSDG